MNRVNKTRQNESQNYVILKIFTLIMINEEELSHSSSFIIVNKSIE